MQRGSQYSSCKQQLFAYRSVPEQLEIGHGARLGLDLQCTTVTCALDAICKRSLCNVLADIARGCSLQRNVNGGLRWCGLEINVTQIGSL